MKKHNGELLPYWKNYLRSIEIGIDAVTALEDTSFLLLQPIYPQDADAVRSIAKFAHYALIVEGVIKIFSPSRADYGEPANEHNGQVLDNLANAGTPLTEIEKRELNTFIEVCFRARREVFRSYLDCYTYQIASVENGVNYEIPDINKMPKLTKRHAELLAKYIESAEAFYLVKNT